MTKLLLNIAVPLAIFAAGVAAAVSAAFWGVDLGPLDWARMTGSYYVPPPSPPPPTTPLPPMGSISGRVTNLDGSPLEGCWVFIEPWGESYGTATHTDNEGFYSVKGRPVGDHRVSAWCEGYLGMYYDDKPEWYEADPVSVAANTETANIDFALHPEGIISGTVTDADGNALEDCHVDAEALAGSGWGYDYTDADGSYTMTGLTTDDYRVEARCEGYVSEYYDGARDWNDADPVPVAEGEVTANIDFSLALGGTISGRVTNADGDPLVTCWVKADTGTDDYYWLGGSTDLDGFYRIVGVPTGEYAIRAYCGNEYVVEYYDGARRRADGTLLSVVEGQDIANIDFSMDIGGTISGRVINAHGNPLSDCDVEAESWDGDNWSDGYTDDAGMYTIPGLPTGDYRVWVWCEGYMEEYYDDARNSDDADAVSVVEGQDTPNIDFELDADSDHDGTGNEEDNCPTVYNPWQQNAEGGRVPNGERIGGEWASNPSQDSLGDDCDADDDNDGIPDSGESDLACPFRTDADSDDDRVVDGYEVSVATDACIASSTPSCVDVPFADGDSDGLSDCIEHSGYNTCASPGDAAPGWSTCASPMDSDGDGCADVLEVMDINGDRRVTIGDLTLLAKRAVAILPPSDSDPVFDVNKDGKISVSDVTLMAKNTCTLRPGLIGCAAGACPPE